LTVGRLLPVYPNEQTFAVSNGMSQMGQRATSALLFDHLVGAGNEVLCQDKTDCAGGLEVD